MNETGKANQQLAPTHSGAISTEKVGALAAVSREQAEIQAACVMAMQRPRNEDDAIVRVLKTCNRAGFAKKARYTYPRGNTQIAGPSVNFAREFARVWGNIRYGYRVVEFDPINERTRIMGWALDLESNSYVSIELDFANRVQRKQDDGSTRWVRPNERDYRELSAKNGAIAERNSILKLFPPDVIEDAMNRCLDTQRGKAKSDLEGNRERTVRGLIEAFTEIAVSTEMLERKLGHSVKDVDADELAQLREIYVTIRDGQSKRDEYFDFQDPAPASDGKKSLDDVTNDLVSGDGEKQPTGVIEPDDPKCDNCGRDLDDDHKCVAQDVIDHQESKAFELSKQNEKKKPPKRNRRKKRTSQK